MKIIQQIGIIFGICWISRIIEYLLPFDFPSSVIGMILLFLCLVTKVLKIQHIQEKSDFLLSNMAFFFIPAGVSMINYLDTIKNTFLQLAIICTVTTVLTFAVTAFTIRFTMKLMSRDRQS